MLGGGTRERFSLSCLFVPLCCIPSVTGWCFALEFIFTLAMAFKFILCSLVVCLALEAMLIGLAKPATVYHEALNNFQGILLRIFMVVGIYFMQNLLLFVSGKVLLDGRLKTNLPMLFAGMRAYLSAFLIALTVRAVIIAVGVGFFKVNHRVLQTAFPAIYFRLRSRTILI